MMIEKCFLVVGGDRRQLELAKTLARRGSRVWCLGFDRLPDEADGLIRFSCLSELPPVDVVILPLPASEDGVRLSMPLSAHALGVEELSERLPGSPLVLGGRLGAMADRLRAQSFEVIDYFDREELAVLNAVPTAEGALQLLLQKSPRTLFGSSVLLTGYGRIARVLARDLRALGASVTVAARRCSDRAWAEVDGCRAVPLSALREAVTSCDFAVNTVPAILFDREVLSGFPKGALFLDLASKPGGVDREAARACGVDTFWALSLPGKTAPVSAGAILADTVENILAERGAG